MDSGAFPVPEYSSRSNLCNVATIIIGLLIFIIFAYLNTWSRFSDIKILSSTEEIAVRLQGFPMGWVRRKCAIMVNRNPGSAEVVQYLKKRFDKNASFYPGIGYVTMESNSEISAIGLLVDLVCFLVAQIVAIYLFRRAFYLCRLKRLTGL